VETCTIIHYDNIHKIRIRIIATIILLSLECDIIPLPKYENNKTNIKRTCFPIEICLYFLSVAVVSINGITDGSR
jgi:hypothetical protein